MTKVINHAATDPAGVEQLRALQLELDAEGKFEFHMRDQTVFKGTVVERPAVVLGVDGDGQEGFNGLVRVDTEDGQSRLIKLEDITRVIRLGSA